MAIRKSTDRENESNDRYTKSKTTAKAANITERFDDTTHNDNPYDDAIQYINKKLDDCIDEINLSDSSKVITPTEKTKIAANHAKVGITSAQATAITANTLKNGIQSEQSDRIKGLGNGIVLKTNQLTITKSGRDELVISDGDHQWILRPS